METSGASLAVDRAGYALLHRERQMLRIIGAIVVVLLLVGPLALQAGLLENAGLVRQFVGLEVQAFADIVNTVRSL
jgi:hypothetical protein